MGRYIAFQRLSVSFRKKLISSLVYPALLVAVLAVMMTFLITFVVPQFATLYHTLGSDLPPMTSAMLAIGVNAKHYFLYVADCRNRGRILPLALDEERNRLDPDGSLQAENPDAWRYLAEVSGGRVFPHAFHALIWRIVAGAVARHCWRVHAEPPDGARHRQRDSRSTRRANLARSLEETKVFPEMSVEMIEVGESTGALPAMLNSIAEFYEEDVQNALTTAMALIEPVILIVMGVVVAFVLISLYLPIFSMGVGGIH